jgi:hypothetical protein
MDLREIGLGGMDWIDLAQDRDKWMALFEHGNEPSGSIKKSSSRKTQLLGRKTVIENSHGKF